MATRLMVLGTAAALIGACATPSPTFVAPAYVTLAPSRSAPVDSSVRSPGASKRCSPLMILDTENSGKPNSGKSNDWTGLERSLMSRGIEVISSSVVGRAKPMEGMGGRQLDDLERALMLAKGSNAACVLHVTTFDVPRFQRHFVLNQSNAFVEVTQQQAASTPTSRAWKVEGKGFVFRGKLIDTERGTVLASLDIAHSAPSALKTSTQIPILHGQLQSPDGRFMHDLDGAPLDVANPLGELFDALSARIAPADVAAGNGQQ